MHKNDATRQYIPGVCNIGPAETGRRYRLGYIGLLFAILLVLLIEMSDVHRLGRLFLCIPVALSFTGFLQARQRFCVKYGLRGVSGIEGMRSPVSITDATYRCQDKKAAIVLILKIVAGTIVITVLYYFLPA